MRAAGVPSLRRQAVKKRIGKKVCKHWDLILNGMRSGYVMAVSLPILY